MRLFALAVLCAGAAFAGESALDAFWRENDGKTVRRLPIGVQPECAFWYFKANDVADGYANFGKIADEAFRHGTYNAVVLSLRCVPDLNDPKTKAAAKGFFAAAHRAGVKVFMDTDVRLAREEFLRRWPEECQSVACVKETVRSADGVVSFDFHFGSTSDHMTWGSKSVYRPLRGRFLSACAIRKRADGSYDFSTARNLNVTNWWSFAKDETQASSGGVAGTTEASSVWVRGRITGLESGETALVTASADFLSADVFSPHLLPYVEELMSDYKALGADGAMRDEWGFMCGTGLPPHARFVSAPMAEAYRAATGRDLVRDLALLEFGDTGDAARSAAIRAYRKIALDRNAAIERHHYETSKRLFGADAYVAKHPTWWPDICAAEFDHNGLDWWQAPRDWAQGDETTPVFALNGMSRKFGGAFWLNEGYTPTPEMNAYRVWTYALCGGRQVYHPLYCGTTGWRYNQFPTDEKERRVILDLLKPDNLNAQCRTRLVSLMTHAQPEIPLAWVFGHERLTDWSDAAYGDYGRGELARLMCGGWWADAYPASEIALGTFRVDDEGWLCVGAQRYAALVLHRPSAAEQKAFDALIGGKALKTRIFDGTDGNAVAAYLDGRKAQRQTPAKGKTWAGPLYPEPDGTLTLNDGTVVRVAADNTHLGGKAIQGTVHSKGVGYAYAAEGLFAVRTGADGQVEALAAGGLRTVKGPGIDLTLEQPEDLVLVRKGDAWRGLWQTSTPKAELSKALQAVTTHWIRLVKPEPFR